MHIFLVGINLPTLASGIQGALRARGTPAVCTGSENPSLGQKGLTKNLSFLTKSAAPITH